MYLLTNLRVVLATALPSFHGRAVWHHSVARLPSLASHSSARCPLASRHRGFEIRGSVLRRFGQTVSPADPLTGPGVSVRRDSSQGSQEAAGPRTSFRSGKLGCRGSFHELIYGIVERMGDFRDSTVKSWRRWDENRPGKCGVSCQLATGLGPGLAEVPYCASPRDPATWFNSGPLSNGESGNRRQGRIVEGRPPGLREVRKGPWSAPGSVEDCSFVNFRKTYLKASVHFSFSREQIHVNFLEKQRRKARAR